SALHKRVGGGADCDLVPGAQHLGLDLDAVDVGAVAAAEVDALVALGGLDDLAVAAGGLDVLEADVAFEAAPEGDGGALQRDLLFDAFNDDRQAGHGDSR